MRSPATGRSPRSGSVERPGWSRRNTATSNDGLFQNPDKRSRTALLSSPLNRPAGSRDHAGSGPLRDGDRRRDRRPSARVLLPRSLRLLLLFRLDAVALVAAASSPSPPLASAVGALGVADPVGRLRELPAVPDNGRRECRDRPRRLADTLRADDTAERVQH